MFNFLFDNFFIPSFKSEIKEISIKIINHNTTCDEMLFTYLKKRYYYNDNNTYMGMLRKDIF